jgi:F-type H+-transporting ATPase subunit b
MEATLHALAGILLKAIPTFIVVLLLHAYLKAMFFKPMAKVLAERYNATEGARLAARESMDAAARKASEYGAALVAARGDLYKEQEDIRKSWRSEQDAAVAAARVRAKELLDAARADIDRETAEARRSMVNVGEELATRIAGRVLQGS